MVFNSNDEEHKTIANPSPFCVKLELYLKVAEIAYDKPALAPGDMGPKGKLPYVKDPLSGESIWDTTTIITHLENKKLGSSLNEDLNPDEKAKARFIVATCEEKLYFVMCYLHWQHKGNWPTTRAEYFSDLPWGLRKLVSGKARKGMVKALYGQGMGRHSLDEVIDIGNQIVDDLALVLGDKRTLFGTPNLTIADIVMYAHLDHFVHSNIPYNPVGDYVKSKPYLVTFINSVTKRFFREVHNNRISKK